MDIYVKIGIAVVIGGGSGFAIGYLTAKSHYRHVADEEIREVKHYYKVKQTELEDALTAPQESEEDIQVREIVVPVIKDTEYVEILEEEEYCEIETVAPKIDDSTNGPHLITFEMFMDDKLEYDKLTLHYYEGDDTLCDEADRIVPNTDELVGVTNLTRWGFGGGGAHTIYVRNNKTGVDYEVLKQEGEYSRAVLGLDEGWGDS